MRIRRALVVFSAVATAWTAVLAGAGGFTIRLGAVRISSHNPRNAALAALVTAVAVAILLIRAGVDERRADVAWLSTSLRSLRRIPAPLVVAIAGVVLDIAQWWSARPLWLDEEMIALNIRDRSL